MSRHGSPHHAARTAPDPAPNARPDTPKQRYKHWTWAAKPLRMIGAYGDRGGVPSHTAPMHRLQHPCRPRRSCSYPTPSHPATCATRTGLANQQGQSPDDTGEHLFFDSAAVQERLVWTVRNAAREATAAPQITHDLYMGDQELCGGGRTTPKGCCSATDHCAADGRGAVIVRVPAPGRPGAASRLSGQDRAMLLPGAGRRTREYEQDE